MADVTSVNSQITDAVTQSNLTTLGDGPAMAMGSVYQSLAHSLGILFENAVAAQQQQAVLAQAATNVGVMQLYGAASEAAAKIAQSDVPDNMLSLLTALRASTGPIPSFADLAEKAATAQGAAADKAKAKSGA
ncbi:RebB family R body protein [Caulobacter sp.]|uniref:RebB family R body protein n=1 Tax=Caulobacter sp. TaxID=78 RepID=UPI003BAE15A1